MVDWLFGSLAPMALDPVRSLHDFSQINRPKPLRSLVVTEAHDMITGIRISTDSVINISHTKTADSYKSWHGFEFHDSAYD